MKLLGREPWSSGDGRRLMSEGHGFKSQHRILDGHFSHLFVVKIAVTKDEKNEKEAVVGPFLTFSKYCWYDRNNNNIFC